MGLEERLHVPGEVDLPFDSPFLGRLAQGKQGQKVREHTL
jgi:hypothetical protein